MKQFRAYKKEGPKSIYLGAVAARDEEIARQVFAFENPGAEIIIVEVK